MGSQMCSLSGLLTRPLNLARKKKNITRLHGRLMLVKPMDSPMYQPVLTPVLGDFNKMVRPHTSLSHQSSFSVQSSEVVWSTGIAKTSGPHTALICHVLISACALWTPSRFPNSNQPQMVNETSRWTLCRGYGCRASPKSCPPYSSVRGAVRGSKRWGIFGHLLRCALQRKRTIRL